MTAPLTVAAAPAAGLVSMLSDRHVALLALCVAAGACVAAFVAHSSVVNMARDREASAERLEAWAGGVDRRLGHLREELERRAPRAARSSTKKRARASKRGS